MGRSIHLIFWILFKNVMSLHRTKAAIIGILDANRANKWVVNEKLGDTEAKEEHQSNEKIQISSWRKVLVCWDFNSWEL